MTKAAAKYQQIASEHKLPPDTFSSAHKNRFCIWISKQAEREFKRAARFQRYGNAQMMVSAFIAENIAVAPEPERARKNSIDLGIRLTEVGLTREQVDPDFAGSDLEFVRTYGQVNLQTKAEIEAEKAGTRANALAVALRDFVKAVPPGITADDVFAWIEQGRKHNARNDEKITERIGAFRAIIEQILPVLDEVEKPRQGGSPRPDDAASS